MFRCVFMAGLVTVAACALAKPPPPAPPRTTNLGLSIKGVTLANGLRVVLVQDPHASEVQVTMRYRIGSGDDLEHPGIAHLVEHLMFQQVLGAQTLFAHLEDNATFFNAYTTFDATTYIARARPDFLDKLLSIEAVRLGFRCMSITDSVFEREREVVIQEAKWRDDAKEMWSALFSAVFPDGHPYRGSHGTAESVATITRAHACAFADSYYAPDNAVLVVSGNLSNQQVGAALGKFIARVPKRVAASPTGVPAAKQMPTREVPAPVDEDALLVSWPLPVEPGDQIAVRALADIARAAIDNQVKGVVRLLELGDVRAPVVAIAVEPGDGETIQIVLDAVQEVFETLPSELGARWMPRQVIEMLRQDVVREHFAALEDGSDRDTRLATHVLAGRDAAEALAAEFRTLRGLDGGQMADVARRFLSFNNVTITTLKPSSAKKRGRSTEVRPATHDMGQRRTTPDIARAYAADTTVPIPAINVRTRVLPNGLKIVLMPISTVPTIDMRMVFGAGTANEPASKRGAGLLAAYGLTWDLRHLNDVAAFKVAGGANTVEVTREHTSFVVKSVDMYLDYSLAALRRWTVDGRYSSGADTLVEVLEQERKRTDENAPMVDAWLAALYGEQHPYAHAGFIRYASSNLTVEDAEQFRRSYFTPDNATLVIAGRFDVALANRWIDYLFTDWRGQATPRSVPPPSFAPASLAKLEELTQLHVLLALPATTGTRAQRLVVASMLDAIAGDVRHQLGAAYGFSASLAEDRLASNFAIGGSIDPARANEVVQFLRDRIAKLRDDKDVAARAFVHARGRVVASLASVTGSASRVASRAEIDIGLGREPMSDLQTAKDVQALTIDQVIPLIAQLDLSRAALFMRGSSEPVKGAFQTLGREPTVLKTAEITDDTHDDPPDNRAEPADNQPKKSHAQLILFRDLEYSMTAQSAANKPALEINAAAVLALSGVGDLIPPGMMSPVENGPTGVIGVIEAGLRFRSRFSAGLQVSLGRLTGTYALKAMSIEIGRESYSIVPVDLGGFVHVQPLDNFWAGFVVGLHFDGVRFDDDRVWSSGMQAGLEGGYDLAHIGDHWVSIYGRASGAFGSEVGLSSVGVGLAYRH